MTFLPYCVKPCLTRKARLYAVKSIKNPKINLGFVVLIKEYFCLGRGGQIINKGVYIKYMTEVNCVVQQSPREKDEV
jgi:hypothetical protein